MHTICFDETNPGWGRLQLAFVYWYGRFFNPKLLPIRAFYVDERLLLGCYLEELGTFDDLLLLLLFCPVLPCAQDLLLSVSVFRGPYVVWGLNWVYLQGKCFT